VAQAQGLRDLWQAAGDNHSLTEVRLIGRHELATDAMCHALAKNNRFKTVVRTDGRQTR
jgi:hypothetical protein